MILAVPSVFATIYSDDFDNVDPLEFYVVNNVSESSTAAINRVSGFNVSVNGTGNPSSYAALNITGGASSIRMNFSFVFDQFRQNDDEVGVFGVFNQTPLFDDAIPYQNGYYLRAVDKLLYFVKYNGTFNQLNQENVSLANQTIQENNTYYANFIVNTSIANLTIYNDSAMTLPIWGFHFNRTEFSISSLTHIQLAIHGLESGAVGANKLYVDDFNLDNRADNSPPTFTTIPANQTLEFYTDALLVDFDATDVSGIDTWKINDTGRFSITQAGILSNITNLNVSIYFVNVSVNDTAGNNASVVYRVNVSDTIGPTISAPGNASITAGDSVDVTFNATDPSNVTSWSLNDSSFNITSLGNLKNNATLSTGTYFINVSSFDAYSNRGSYLYSVTVSAAQQSSGGGGGGGAYSSDCETGYIKQNGTCVVERVENKPDPLLGWYKSISDSYFGGNMFAIPLIGAVLSIVGYSITVHYKKGYRKGRHA